jgi:hypothetical protein
MVWHHHPSHHQYQGGVTSTSPDQRWGRAKEGTKADKKRRKQRHQEATTNVDEGINDRAGGSSAEHATKSVSNIKRQVQPPKDHFEKPLAETCLNHAYTIKHKL